MSRRPKFTEDALSERIIEIQKAHPKWTEGAICAELGVARTYISERSKDSDKVSEARKIAHAIRERAWLLLGIQSIEAKGKPLTQPQATLYIWMTRNILGWRDKQPEESADANETEQVSRPLVPLTPQQVVELVQQARDGKK